MPVVEKANLTRVVRNKRKAKAKAYGPAGTRKGFCNCIVFVVPYTCSLIVNLFFVFVCHLMDVTFGGLFG